MNPLTSCIFKATDLTKHMVKQKELSENKEVSHKCKTKIMNEY